MTHDAQRPTDVTDVGAIIARAAELKAASEETLTAEQLREVGAELGIEGAFVDAAVRDLRERQARATAARTARDAKRRARTKTIIGAVVAFDVVLFGLGGVAWSSAQQALAPLRLAEAQVAGALARQHDTEALFSAQRGTREADAELAGALNRVAIAKKRYDEAAVAYNARGALAVIGGFLVGAPDQAAPSSARSF